MRRDYAVILAVLLILVGVIIFGVVTVRVWQEGSSLRMDIDTQQDAALNTGLLGTPTAPLLAGVESGSMALGTPAPLAVFAVEGGVQDAPQEPVITILPVTIEATVDPCPPQAEGGFPADATVTAIGSLRLYSAPDVLSPALGEFSAGQAFLVTADTGGVTAIRRCDLVWVRVRLTGGSMGWCWRAPS